MLRHQPYHQQALPGPPCRVLPPAIGQDQKDPTHTANFGVKLAEHCAANGVSAEVHYRGAKDIKHESPTAFLLAKLKPAGK